MNAVVVTRIEYNEDVDRIVHVFAKRDMVISKTDAYRLWKSRSSEQCVGWLIMNNLSDDDLFLCCVNRVEISDVLGS